MAPAAALVLITLGVYLNQHSRPTQVVGTATTAPVEAVSDAAVAGLNDADLLQEIAQQAPALQAQYADNLRRVNQYIEDAKYIVAAEPNDEEARRSLMDAYQEKALLFELALDRSLQ